MKRKLLLTSIITLCILLLSGCGDVQDYSGYEHPIVTMEIENYGTIKMELYPEYAPNTVANFVNLIQDGFYDNNNFHRLVPGFVLQGGDPTGTGSGGPGYSIAGEFKINNYYKNTITHNEAIISMARRQNDYDSAGSQFFIVLNDQAKSSLDGMYAAFGKVIEGMDIIKQIEATEEIENPKTGKLVNNITITKTTVDTKGNEYKVIKK